jgi:hypothetical protein
MINWTKTICTLALMAIILLLIGSCTDYDNQNPVPSRSATVPLSSNVIAHTDVTLPGYHRGGPDVAVICLDGYKFVVGLPRRTDVPTIVHQIFEDDGKVAKCNK